MQINTSQKTIMLQFLKERPFMITRRKRKMLCKPAELQLAWMELCDKLNSVPGVRQEWIFWRQLWRDMSKKAIAKRRRIQYRKEQNLPCSDTLSAEELKIISVVKQSYAGKKSDTTLTDIFAEDKMNGKSLRGGKLETDQNMKDHEKEFSDVESLLSEHMDIMALVEDQLSNKNNSLVEKNQSEKNEIKTMITAQPKEEEILNVCEKCVNVPELELLHFKEPKLTPKQYKLVNISNRSIYFKNDKIEIVTLEEKDTLKSVTRCNGHDYFRTEYNDVNVNSDIISTNDCKDIETKTISSVHLLEDKFRKARLLKQKHLLSRNKLEVKKIKLLERLVAAKERCATANEQSALAKGKIARNLYHLANSTSKKQSST